MDYWGARIYNYCERGQDSAFWAEPLNAVSNAAFIIAAIIATFELLSQPKDWRGLAEAALILLVYVIGTGSFLFHTYATRWASIADTAPIGLFMLAYFGYALRRYLGLHWVLVLLCVGGFVASLQYAGGIQCRPQFLPITAAASARCLNGTLAYAPALVALVLISAVLLVVRHAAWRYLGAASVVFFASMTFRTLDFELCRFTHFAGHVSGTHFLWHVLNAVVLYLLLRAAILYGVPRPAPAQ
jgi:hypothetical protein